jgi:hypothetical protein
MISQLSGRRAIPALSSTLAGFSDNFRAVDQADNCIIMGAEAHFGLRRQSEATTALFHSGVILWCIERQGDPKCQRN